MANANRIRDPEFAKRFATACDLNTSCPPMHQGRHIWIRDELLKRYGLSVSSESIRKWYYGESRPAPKKMRFLAMLFNVGEAWLSLGIDADVPEKQIRARNALAGGIVNILAGLIQIDGGSPAFPDEDDKRAKKDNVDIYAIIRGVNYSIHAVSGEPVEDGFLRFVCPSNHDSVVILGLVRTGAAAFDIYEIREEVLAEKGNRKRDVIELIVKPDILKKVESFRSRF
jgi:hypothetical protein